MTSHSVIIWLVARILFRRALEHIHSYQSSCHGLLVELVWFACRTLTSSVAPNSGSSLALRSAQLQSTTAATREHGTKHVDDVVGSRCGDSPEHRHPYSGGVAHSRCGHALHVPNVVDGSSLAQPGVPHDWLQVEG